MGSISKGFAVFLILIIVISGLSLLMVKPANAQSIPKPSVPEFSLKYVNSSYLVPETPYYQTDPYTGKQKYIGMEGGYLFKNYTIEISVKSQSFPSKINYTTLQLYYNIRAKGLYEQDWRNLNLRSDDQIDRNYLPIQQNSEYTTISIPANTYTPGGTVEFQVRAILGGDFPSNLNDYPGYGGYFGYEASDWSDTQSITIPLNSVSNSTPNPTLQITSSPTVPEFNVLILIPLLAAVLFAIIALKVKSKGQKVFER